MLVPNQREDFAFNPLHYLALLDQKIGALDHAAPLVGWHSYRKSSQLRWLLEARLRKPSERELIQVLRFLEIFGLADVRAAVREALTVARSTSMRSSTWRCAVSSDVRRG